CRIKTRAVGPNALSDRRVERFLAPRADSRLQIRRDIGSNDIAEWGFDRPTARERLSAGNRMAARAVRRDGKIATPLDLGEFLRIGSVGSRAWHHREPQRCDASKEAGNALFFKHRPISRDFSDTFRGLPRPPNTRARRRS